MMRRITFVLALAAAFAGAVVIDRIAAVVNKHAIKLSDVDRDLRLTEFLNREPLNLAPDVRRKAADRLVDQSLIADQITAGGFSRPTAGEAASLVSRLRRDRFGGSDPRLRQALTTYGITEEQLQAQLLWQLEVLRFIDQRFRPSVMANDDDLHAYYTQHLAELQREFPKDSSFQTLEQTIRDTVEGERVNQAFDQWLKQQRERTRVDYRQEAFQ